MRDTPTTECDIGTLREMLTFVVKENGSKEAQEGYHDDLVMAKAIANFIAVQQGDSNWKKVKKEKTYRNAIEKFFDIDNYDEEEKESYVEW